MQGSEPLRIHFLYRSQQDRNDPGSSHTDKSTSTVTTPNNKVESMWNSAAVAYFRVISWPFPGWMRKNQRKRLSKKLIHRPTAETLSECKPDALPIESMSSVMSGHKTVNIYDRLACGSLPDTNNSCLAAAKRNVLITGVPVALEHQRVSQALLLTLAELMDGVSHTSSL